MARPSVKCLMDMDSADNRRRLMSQVGALRGAYEIDLSPRRPSRSLQQLRWYWSCIVGPFWEFLRDQDYTVGSEDEAHEFLKARFLATTVLSKRTGEVLGRRVRSTSELSTEQMGDYCERCRLFLSDFCNIVVPDPDPDWSSAPSKGVAAAS